MGAADVEPEVGTDDSADEVEELAAWSDLASPLADTGGAATLTGASGEDESLGKRGLPDRPLEVDALVLGAGQLLDAEVDGAGELDELDGSDGVDEDEVDGAGEVGCLVG